MKKVRIFTSTKTHYMELKQVHLIKASINAQNMNSLRRIFRPQQATVINFQSFLFDNPATLTFAIKEGKPIEETIAEFLESIGIKIEGVAEVKEREAEKTWIFVSPTLERF